MKQACYDPNSNDQIDASEVLNDSGVTGASVKDALDALAAADIRDFHESLRAATTGPLPANTRLGNVLTAAAPGALPPQDGVALVAGDDLLVQNEALGENNGFYTVTSAGSGILPFVLTRRQDADTSAEVTSGMAAPIEEGTVYGDKLLFLATNDPIVLNTTSLTFALLGGGAPSPHLLGGVDHSADTLANLESKITDFELQGVAKDVVTTTNATATTIQTFPLDDNTVYDFTVEAKARRTDSADRGAFKREGTFYREAAGAAVQQGSTLTPKSEGNSNLNVIFMVSGNNVLVQVVGIAAQTWNWKATTRYGKVS
jgi:hypothetical protein